ncbi:hypothetical protein SDC9_129591 [bioreactor metagenome]|uniref:Uncharacterized protein n=1 Tax=bioreactor metagenome TaxID=1076179 RepID=A0A645CZ93_9ZZZZ
MAGDGIQPAQAGRLQPNAQAQGKLAGAGTLEGIRVIQSDQKTHLVLLQIIEVIF